MAKPQEYSYLKTQAYNTAMSVNMKLTLPSDRFETYYLKVDPRAYFTAIDVTYKDGTTQTITPEEWQDNSVEENADGNKFSIALMEGERNLAVMKIAFIVLRRTMSCQIIL
ncbi:MAG: hypothetical protein ACLT16_13225 [[Clostridium] innocuum]